MSENSIARDMNTYSPKEYWSGVADRAGGDDAAGFAPVLHPDAPEWFNRLIDDLQWRAVRKAIEIARIPPGARILDVGCGTGRWLRRFLEFGFQPTGVDATHGMLRLARSRQTVSPLIAGEAFRLPFADAAFDCVSDITVVQHIPVELQPAALAEMMRVLKPNGTLILFELIRGHGTHIFPHEPKDWIQQVTRLGGELNRWYGQEFLLFDRAFVRLARAIARRQITSPQLNAPAAPIKSRSGVQNVSWGLRHATATVSAWFESTAQMILPQSIATHGVFVFRK